MQVSVAAYACTGMAALVSGERPMVAADDAMTDCEGIDIEQRALCHSHCHDRSATADISFPPPVALPGIDLIATLLVATSLRPVLESNPTTSDVLARATAPPISVLHCCFRN